jgi:hypothetical protein
MLAEGINLCSDDHFHSRESLDADLQTKHGIHSERSTACILLPMGEAAEGVEPKEIPRLSHKDGRIAPGIALPGPQVEDPSLDNRRL